MPTLPPGVSFGTPKPPNYTRPNNPRPATPAKPSTSGTSPTASGTDPNNGRFAQFGPRIAILNSSTVVDAAETSAAVAAMQIQLDRDFAPVWGTTANLRVIGSKDELRPNDWLLEILDNSDVQGALGYHDLTPSGQPVGKVFAGTDKQYGLSWTVTLSHEVLEMVMDPYITTTVFNQTSNTGGLLYAFEMCDACEDDSMGYQINGVLLSDFICPTWFEGFRTPGSTKFDFGGKLRKPFEIGRGGYSSVFPIPNRRGWVQVYGQSQPGKRLMMKAQRRDLSSRTLRRQDGGENKLHGRSDQPPNLQLVSVPELVKEYGDDPAVQQMGQEQS